MLVVPPRAELRPRLPRLVLGLVLCGVGLAIMVRARLGLGPWEVLHQGISNRTGVPIGTVGIGVGFVVLLLWIPLRQRLGVGTIANVILIGLVIDLTLFLVPTFESLPLRIACMLGGIVGMGVGSGFYIGAGLGAGPRDGLMTGIADRGYSLRLVRTLIELSALGLGWLLGGNVGIGTLLFAVLIGPIVQLFLGRLTLPSVRSADEAGTLTCRLLAGAPDAGPKGAGAREAPATSTSRAALIGRAREMQPLPGGRRRRARPKTQ